MRISHAVTALAAFTAGVAAAATLRRRAGNRPAVAPTVTTTALPRVAPIPDRAVVLPFARPVVTDPETEHLASHVRCGDSGGRTKAGAPCGARTTIGGRCHHHPMAA